MNQADKPRNDDPDHAPKSDPARGAEHMTDEADIGSGERTPAQRETDEHIKSIPPLPHDKEDGRQQS